MFVPKKECGFLCLCCRSSVPLSQTALTILIDYILWINREYSNKNNISYPDLMDFGLWITNTPDHPLGSDGNIVHARAPLPATLDSRGISRHLLLVRDANNFAVAYVYLKANRADALRLI